MRKKRRKIKQRWSGARRIENMQCNAISMSRNLLCYYNDYAMCNEEKPNETHTSSKKKWKCYIEIKMNEIDKKKKQTT